MKKRASVNWTVGKLLNIVLLMIVFALVAYGISTQSLKPLWDNLSGKFDEVKILSPWSDDVASGECHKENVANLGGGKDFLKAIGMEGKEVILYVCKNRICNISGDGLGAYRTNKGKFEKLENGKWVDYNYLIDEGIGSAEFNWKLYNEGVSVLGEAGLKDLYDKGFTKKFVLYGKSLFSGNDIYAVWQNGYWRVTKCGQMPDGVGWIKDGDEWSFDTNKGGWGSIIKVTNLYSGMDDNDAINAFVKRVKGGDDDKVYWSELEFDEIYNKDVDKDINSRLVPGKLAVSHNIKLSWEQVESAIWVSYGKVIKVDDNIYMARIDENKRLEINVGGNKEDMQHWQHVMNPAGCYIITEKSGGTFLRCDFYYKNLDKEVTIIEKSDTEIFTKRDIEDYFGNLNKGTIGTLVGNIGTGSDFDELDDDEEVKKLKEEFAKMKEEYLSEARVSVKDFGKGIVGEEVTIKDKEFIVGIEDDSEFPIITFSSNGEKFGFKHGVYINVNSDFIKGVKLRDFPLSLVEWDGSEWKEAGNEEYYRLPKENFDEVYRATLINRFLKTRCR